MKARAIVALSAVILLVGCSPSGSQDSEGVPDALHGLDMSDASEEQTAEIRDRKATNDEYQSAFYRYRACLSAAGYELSDVVLTNSVYEFGVPSDAVESGADEKCYASEFRYVDMLWQSTDAVQDQSETARFVRECLTEHGIEPADTLRKMESQINEEGIDISACAS